MGSSPSKPIRSSHYSNDVPPTLQFCRERHMVLASVMFKTRKIMCFPTQHSFELFKNNHRKIEANEEGMGVPSLVLEDPYFLTRVFKGDGVRYRIYKYVVGKAKEPLPHQNCEVMAQAGDVVIYRMPFCEVYQSLNKGLRPGYTFVFHTPSGFLNVELVKHRTSFSMDSRLGEWNVTWKRSKSSILLPDQYDLVALHPSTPTLLDDDQTAAAKKKASRQPRPDLAVWARYCNTDISVLPKITTKLASLDVGEIELDANPASYGLCEIPWYTQVIACMGLVMCQRQEEEKSAKQRRRRRNNNV